jgi:hypothetical protein
MTPPRTTPNDDGTDEASAPSAGSLTVALAWPTAEWTTGVKACPTLTEGEPVGVSKATLEALQDAAAAAAPPVGLVVSGT